MDTSFLHNLKVDLVYSKVVNFSLQQNHMPVVRQLSVTNLTEEQYDELIIQFEFEPGFASTDPLILQKLNGGEVFRFDNIEPKLSATFLSELTERMSGLVKLKIICKERLLVQNEYVIDILAFDQWQGISILPETLASFITPNNPKIAGILSSAADYLNNWTGSPSFDEYQSRNVDRVKKQMAAVFAALRELAIVYCVPPSSFEESGQRIRMVDTVLSQKIGTCLDMSLLYASCLEAIGLHPIVAIVKGHAFAGAWLIDDTFADIVNDDPSLLTKRIATGINEILLVESTVINSGTVGSFDDAINTANYYLAKSEDFQMFLDIKRSRYTGIRPLPQRIKSETGWIFEEDVKTVPPSGPPEDIPVVGKLLQTIRKEVTKQELWERKLLDLSLRNSLLNTRITNKTIQLISVSLNKLEDALSDGAEFQFLPKPDGWDNHLIQGGIYQSLHQSDPVIDLVSRDMSQHRLRTYRNEIDLAQGLTNLYRASRLSLEENGANTLYMCLGLLKWFETPSSELPRFAPIILLPVELKRKSAQRGFVLRSREEDPMLNITLVEMLRQDYDIKIKALDPLPRDGSGVDVKAIFNTFREIIMREKRWDIEEQAILGTFSFNKFIMWNDIHINAASLAKNRIVASLISGRAEWDVEANQFAVEDLDEKYNPAETAFPLAADSSQVEAICGASSDKSFVLHGPPGTGKSQTITNIIASALYKGKKVLFVAEKMAALSVVQKRLEDVGLAPFCLELHSNKSKKSDFLEQLHQTSQMAKKSSPEEFRLEAERIGSIRKGLNGYVRAVHKKYSSGFSLFDALSGYALLPDYPRLMSFNSSDLDNLTSENIRIWGEYAEDLMTAGEICSQPFGHPLTGIKAMYYDARIRSAASELMGKYATTLKDLEIAEAEVRELASINVTIKSCNQLSTLYEFCRILSSANDVSSSLLDLEDSDKLLEIAIKVSEYGLRRNKYRESLLVDFNSDILKLDASGLKETWNLSQAKWFLPKAISQGRIKRELRHLSLARKIHKTRILPVLDEVINYQKEQAQIDSYKEFVAPALGSVWNNGEADWAAIERDCVTVVKLKKSLAEFFGDPAQVRISRHSLAFRLKRGYSIFLDLEGKKLRNYMVCYESWQTIGSELSNLLSISFEELNMANEEYVQNLVNYCNSWISGIDDLREWVGWNQVRQKAIDIGLSQLVSHYEKDEVKGSDLVSFLMKSIYKSMADHITTMEPILTDFNGIMFEKKINKFRELNYKLEELSKKEIYARLATGIPDFTREVAQSSEIGILLRNIKSGGRGISIRKLFDTIPGLLTRMCPCMLMSPISVAQYINIDNFKFDLIIFDEASQMPTCEAVGTIARGRNLIVVGDPKQLPPTNFFATNNIDEENLEKEDLESILDDCLALSLPSKHLLWHYRSKHESLISFSNTHYYGNSLMTFPSPDDLNSRVEFIHVPGFYDRGKTRQNRNEALAIIEEIKRRLTNHDLSKKSIGVVTFSSSQQILIEDMLTDAFRESQDLEAAAETLYEPIFIKNLENVQGDERDVILFSVGYGPDKENKVFLNFGPLNREGGWRRLNVAVSRARQEMKVFSTIRSDQIDITRTASNGVAGLKAFLEFAEKGKTSLPFTKVSSKGQASGIVDSLARGLRSKGIRVTTNIGCSGFRIDIGIIDSEHPEKYTLGILCDGLNYKESKTAKDREIIKAEVLRQLGWRIHRVWSCDWWYNADKVLEEIIRTINKPIDPAPATSTDMIDDLLSPVIGPERRMPGFHPLKNGNNLGTFNKPGSPYINQKQYVVYTPDKHIITSDPGLLQRYDLYEKITGDIRFILSKEAPISQEMLSKRVMAAWHVTKIGSRIESYLGSVFSKMQIRYTISGRKFFWDTSQEPDAYSYFRVPVPNQPKRDVEDIPFEEISNAVNDIVTSSVSLEYNDLIRQTASLFGFARTGEIVKKSMIKGIDKAIRRGFIRIEGNRVFASI